MNGGLRASLRANTPPLLPGMPLAARTIWILWWFACYRLEPGRKKKNERKKKKRNAVRGMPLTHTRARNWHSARVP